jgi:hypothetical protein
MIDWKFSKNKFPNYIDLVRAILWINDDNYGIVIYLFPSLKSFLIITSCSSYEFKEKCLKQQSDAGKNKETVESSFK